MKASVVVCTFNRSELLADTIKSLQNLNYSASDYEIVIVDNNSTDSTKDVVAELSARGAVPVKYVLESRQGLSYARNTGIEHSCGEIIVFTDDDIEADRDWLQEMLYAFGSPDVYCAGGPIRPVWLSPRPTWLTDMWVGYLTVQEFEYALESGELNELCYPCGANIAFRKYVFQDLGCFETRLGRKGNLLLSNEESRMCSLIVSAGKKIRLARNAVIYHKIPADRLTRKWFYNRLYWQGVSDAVMDISLHKESNSVAYSIGENFRRWTSAGLDRFAYKCISKYIRGYIAGVAEDTIQNNNKKSQKLQKVILQSFANNNKLQSLLDDCSDVNNALKDINNGLEDKICRYEASLSWKITYPLRRIGIVLHKLLHFVMSLP